MKHYVVGFLHDKRNVLLIEKKTPEWQAGLLNGIGGKIEPTDANSGVAMRREFFEETGIIVEGWRKFVVLSNKQKNFVLHCFTKYDENIYLNKYHGVTHEKETLMCVDRNMIDHIAYDRRMIPNLRWLIPMSYDKDAPSALILENTYIEDLSRECYSSLASLK